MSLEEPKISMLGRFSRDLAQSGRPTDFWDCEPHLPDQRLLEVGGPHMVKIDGRKILEDLFETRLINGAVNLVPLQTEFEGPDAENFARILTLVQTGELTIEEIQLIYAAAKKSMLNLVQANEDIRETICGDLGAQRIAAQRILTTIESLFQAYGIDGETDSRMFSMERITSAMRIFSGIMSEIIAMAFMDLEIELFQEDVARKCAVEVNQSAES